MHEVSRCRNWPYPLPRASSHLLTGSKPRQKMRTRSDRSGSTARWAGRSPQKRCRGGAGTGRQLTVGWHLALHGVH